MYIGTLEILHLSDSKTVSKPTSVSSSGCGDSWFLGVLVLVENEPNWLYSRSYKLVSNVAEKDVYDFFAFCGAIEHVEIVRAGEYGCTAYVTFRNSHALETAVLLSDSQGPRVVPSAGEAMSLAQDVVKTMAARGYILGKDALGKAKAFDESHQVSATAVAKVAELSERIGLTDKIFAGVEAARIVDQRYHISDTTKSAVAATSRTAVSAAHAVVNSSYFSKGALWVSGALSRASQVAADLGSRGVNK
ncbi:Binding partner of ACD11 1 [Sesamum angolense]|uniref:Binding partner of ACD11 1 n=1 Tax=Sesamum angolense TaxID=2727404 RepID=A0AAE1X0B5_9LAMI|nr:Binding partner of ACD11 1 [Sesamum angolense]